MKHPCLLFLVCLVVAACRKDPQELPSYLVLEGWIENGGHPYVLLSESIPLGSDRDVHPADLVASMAKWARVTVTDGTRDVVLTGYVDQRYFPPYVYSTDEITGVVGKTYDIRVEYKDYLATATTTIPEPVPIDSLRIRTRQDSTCTIGCCFTDPPAKGNYYKVFTMTSDKDRRWQPSSMACVSDEVIDGPTEVPLFCAQRMMDYLNYPNLYYGDDVWVKLCTMDEYGYRFWKNFELSQSSSLGIIWLNNKVESNIQGAVGYWIGYGVDKPKRIYLR
ncbi:MAG: DUF4249 domain-containing protein [Bacteroidales bacterium]|nr:DUF4249 domain-containing protein [Bacteroidales bacterium]